MYFSTSIRPKFKVSLVQYRMERIPAQQQSSYNTISEQHPQRGNL
jgi:hypothetical protein